MVGEGPGSAAVVLLIALMAIPAAGAQVYVANHATYVIEHDEGEVTYDAYETTMPALECEGDWVAVDTSVGATESDRHLIRISVLDTDEVRIHEKHEGTVIRSDFACTGTASRSSSPPATGWRSHQASSSDDPGDPLLPAPVTQGPCDGEPAFSLERLAPFVETAQQSQLPDPGGKPSCVEARGAAEVPQSGDVPFTGNVTATLTGPEGHEVWSRSCTIVVGTCWDDGQGSFELPEGSFPVTDQWTLTCDTEQLFDSFIPPVGTFSCRAWLGGSR